MSERVEIEVVYATCAKQKLVSLEVPAGTTALEAVKRSGLEEEFPEMAVDENALGVFSRKVAPDYVMQPGDRLEIYRPLKADPKETRRRRAKQQRHPGKPAGFVRD